MSEIKISITFAWLGEQNREDQRNNHKQVSMATPIKNTPILEGMEADTFLENLARRANSANTEDRILEREKEMKRLRESFDTIQSVSRGSF